MNFQECLSKAKPKTCVVGGQNSQGRYYRSLEESSVSKRCSDDNDIDPEYGYRINRPDKWRWTNGDSQDGLSVSCGSCLKCVACPVVMNKDRYTHSVSINLPELALALGMELVAVHDPTDTNPYHYNIIPTSEAPDTLKLKLREWMKSNVPTDVKRTTLAQKDPDNRGWTAYSKVFELHYRPNTDCCP